MTLDELKKLNANIKKLADENIAKRREENKKKLAADNAAWSSTFDFIRKNMR